MRRPLLLFAGLVIVAMPILSQVSPESRSNSSNVAYAGRTLTGGYCICGCPGCICDPEEQIEMCLPGAKESPIDQPLTKQYGGDLGAPLLLLLAAGRLLTKVRGK